MIIKLFEIRGRGTFMPMVAFSTISMNVGQNYLLDRAGYAPDSHCIMFGYFAQSGMQACYDPYDWNNRTKKAVHAYIEKYWKELKDGDVIDVEHILGESDKPKISERLEIL
jgi:hypothetical protein